jgi:hypothetical protein
MKYFLLLLLLAIPQGQEEKKYEPTEVQSLRLQVKQKDTQLAQIAFQRALGALYEEASKVKKENNWPNELVINPDTLTFSMPPKPPEQKKK